MKIDDRRIVPFGTTKPDKKSPATAAKSGSSEASSSSSRDSVDSRLSNALDSAVKGIESSGLTAGQVHSQVDEVRAAALLRSSHIDAVQPRLSDEDILKMADKVAVQSRTSPEQAVKAFNEFDSSRVAELVQGH